MSIKVYHNHEASENHLASIRLSFSDPKVVHPIPPLAAGPSSSPQSFHNATLGDEDFRIPTDYIPLLSAAGLEMMLSVGTKKAC